MTEREAIQALKFDMEMILFDPYEGKKRTPEEVKAINEANYLCYLADEMAIKALEKQIPKKPNTAIDSTWGIKREVPVCPVCDYYLTKVYWLLDGAGETKKVTFCETCGQAIDWE